jgi:hypothetical protein
VLYQIWGGVPFLGLHADHYNRKRRLIELETLDALTDVDRMLRLVTVK